MIFFWFLVFTQSGCFNRTAELKDQIDVGPVSVLDISILWELYFISVLMV